MSMNEPRSIHAAEDWGVVLQSVPSKNKKEIVKRLAEIFELDKHDAEQVLSNMPLILVDNLSFGLAARIKKFFQKIGAVAETTNHDMIKKNCFQIVWPQTPDLSYFMKDETKTAEGAALKNKEEVKRVEVPHPEKTPEGREPGPELSKMPDMSVPASMDLGGPEVEAAQPVQEPPDSAPQPRPTVEEKPAEPSRAGIDSEWEKRANELNEKLRKIQDEKQELHEQHAEATEKVKSEFQRRIDQEKQKSDEIAKAYEDLREQAQKQEALTKEGEEWRSKAMALGEKVRELETNLMQKTSAIEHLVQQKDDLEKRSAKAEDLAARVSDLEGIVAAKDKEKIDLQHRISDFEKDISEARRELEGLRSREHESIQKAAGLERNVQEMKESLRARDASLAQFEKQMSELTEPISGIIPRLF